MLCCNETVTLVRHFAERDGDRYECEVIVGVSWYGRRGSVPTGDGFEPRDEYTVRIPAQRVPEPLPKADDYLVRGILAKYTGRRCLEGREHFRITFVGDNRRGRFLPHVVVKNV